MGRGENIYVFAPYFILYSGRLNYRASLLTHY